MHFRSACLAASIVVTFAVAACGMHDFGSRQSDQRIYDRAGILTPGQLEALEQRAVALEALGVPNIVYIRVQSATREQTRQRAGELLSAWRVQSDSWVQDGFVMLLELAPEDARHGNVGLYAGKGLADHSGLPSAELDRIANDVVRPALLDGDLETAIAGGLDAATANVQQAQAADPPGWGRLLRDPLLLGILLVTIVPTLLVLAWMAR